MGVATILLVTCLVIVAAIAAAALVVWRWGGTWVARLIEWRLGGYRHPLHTPDPTLPERVAGAPPTVAVVGSGLAGLSAAALLAERGFAVTVLERNDYLGGKVGAWTETLEDGGEAYVEHGFHAFFRHYYNLAAFMRKIGAAEHLRSIGTYAIVAADGRHFAFGDDRSAPLLNLIGLARKGVYNLRKVALGPTGQRLDPFLRYDADETFAALDDVSFARFSTEAELPSDLGLVFNTFARAFFADNDRLSTAELIKSFHFYYLSHDEGLIYDYVDGTYAEGLLAPLARYITDRDGTLKTGTAVTSIERGMDGLVIDGATFDHVVLAADVGAAKRILEASPILAEDPALAERIARMKSGQRYAVVRLWVGVPSRVDLPVFVSTERLRALDSVTFVDRVDPDLATWARDTGGGVLELHCYAVPDDLDDEKVRTELVAELAHHFPEYRDAEIRREHVQIRDDFTALHVGMHRDRPPVVTNVEGLTLAGDWVRLECPAMLMEAAHTSGLLAANAICQEHGVRGEPAWTVPQKGVLAGLPGAPSPARARPTGAA